MENKEKNDLLQLKRLLSEHDTIDTEEVYKYLKSFLCHRFDLEEVSCETDDILELAELSIAKREQLIYEGKLSEEEAPNLCSGASTALSKKILFLLTLEKTLNIEFLPEDIPFIKSIKDICEYLVNKKKGFDKKTIISSSDMPLSRLSNTNVELKESLLHVEKIRSDFPILKRTVYGKPFIYLDNAATTQLPFTVIQAVSEFYKDYNANVHRSLHYLNRKTTALLEGTREKIQKFINASNPYEIIFTRGTTESINMVAHGFKEVFIEPGDEIVVTEMEHHSNLIPWQQICKSKKALLKIIPFDDNGNLVMDVYEGMLSKKTKIVAITHVSNVLGTLNPIKKIIDLAHIKDIPVLVDAAQSIRHKIVDVAHLDCDFLCFSGHKMMAPSGIGVLYGKKRWLEKIPPLSYGGGMIESSTLYDAQFKALPYKFEAGTYNTGGIIGLKAAITYLEDIGFENIQAYESALMDYLIERLSSIKGLKFVGTPSQRIGVVSFVIEDIPSDDIAIILDQMGIAVRSGHHCAIPLLKHYNLDSCVRVSPAFYNTKEEIDTLIEALIKASSISKDKGLKS